ncbi:unnamed protein product [Alternaria alternata]
MHRERDAGFVAGFVAVKICTRDAEKTPQLNRELDFYEHTLSFLHDEAKVVHTDINPRNIMLTVDDNTILENFEKAEAENPSPFKVIDDTRTIYSSRELPHPTGGLWGQLVLCDFGEARIGDSYFGLIQPELYCALEIIFEMEWGSKVWDLFEDEHLFDAYDNEGNPLETHYVSEMVAYLGMPPLEYTQSNHITKKVFDKQGHWTGGSKGVTIPKISLEERVSVLKGEEKELFLDFIRSMLRWRPEDRKSATELLKHLWMADTM